MNHQGGFRAADYEEKLVKCRSTLHREVETHSPVCKAQCMLGDGDKIQEDSSEVFDN